MKRTSGRHTLMAPLYGRPYNPQAEALPMASLAQASSLHRPPHLFPEWQLHASNARLRSGRGKV